MKERLVVASALVVVLASLAAMAQAPPAGAGEPPLPPGVTVSEDAVWEMVRSSNDRWLLNLFMTGFTQSRHLAEARKLYCALPRNPAPAREPRDEIPPSPAVHPDPSCTDAFACSHRGPGADAAA